MHPAESGGLKLAHGLGSVSTGIVVVVGGGGGGVVGVDVGVVVVEGALKTTVMVTDDVPSVTTTWFTPSATRTTRVHLVLAAAVTATVPTFTIAPGSAVPVRVTRDVVTTVPSLGEVTLSANGVIAGAALDVVAGRVVGVVTELGDTVVRGTAVGGVVVRTVVGGAVVTVVVEGMVTTDELVNVRSASVALAITNPPTAPTSSVKAVLPMISQRRRRRPRTIAGTRGCAA
jgi:hypothetical protein